MLIPPFIVITALQLAGPQDADVSQIPPWQDIPANVQSVKPEGVPFPPPVGPSLERNPAANIPGTPPVMPPEMRTTSPALSPSVLSAPSPESSVPAVFGVTGGNSAADMVHQPFAAPPFSSFSLFPPEREEIFGKTIVYEDRIEIRSAAVKEDYAPVIGSQITGTIIAMQTPKCDRSGRVMMASDGKPVMIDIRHGTLVFKDQIICQLDDRPQQAQKAYTESKLAIAKREAEKTIEVEYADAGSKVQNALYNISLRANERIANAVANAELIYQYLQCVQALLQVQKAQYDLDTKKIELDMHQQELNVAETEVKLRQIRSPINGMVVKIATEAGSVVREGEPIMKIVQLDKLKVVGKVECLKVDQRMIDKKHVTIKATYPGGHVEEFEGFVRFASPMIESGRTFEIEVEVTNRRDGDFWLLGPGKFVDLTIPL
ncbi:MAG: HlyD family efflux transporter periplasmic adaptor subunit [Planctomycetaceae bacterium]|jgi:macrolide-specific efflux system membrane fusion protein|nr:HlyD family efflux transporter periplasmic adaptor subunit [Planctomycetaceae bacterium]